MSADELQKRFDTAVNEYKRWRGSQPPNVDDQLARLLGLIALDELRCEAKGFPARPWDTVLIATGIVHPDSIPHLKARLVGSEGVH